MEVVHVIHTLMNVKSGHLNSYGPNHINIMDLVQLL